MVVTTKLLHYKNNFRIVNTFGKIAGLRLIKEDLIRENHPTPKIEQVIQKKRNNKRESK